MDTPLYLRSSKITTPLGGTYLYRYCMGVAPGGNLRLTVILTVIYAFATLSNVLLHLRLTCITFTVGQLIKFSIKLYYVYGGVSYYI